MGFVRLEKRGHQFTLSQAADQFQIERGKQISR